MSTTTTKENKTVKTAKEIIALQTDIIAIESIISKAKHNVTIDGLNSIKEMIINRTHELSKEAQGGNE